MPKEVTISLEDYNQILWKSKMFDLLKDALFENATLDYSGKSLAFDGNRIDVLLCGIDYFNYESKIQELRAGAKE